MRRIGHLRAPAAEERVQGLRRIEHLRAPTAKEQVQALQRIGHLRAPAAKGPMQGMPCQSCGERRRVLAPRIGRALAASRQAGARGVGFEGVEGLCRGGSAEDEGGRRRLGLDGACKGCEAMSAPPLFCGRALTQ